MMPMPGTASVGAAAGPFSFLLPIQSRSAPSSSRRLLAAAAVGLPMHPLLAVAAAVAMVPAIIMCRAPITPIGRNPVSARAIPVQAIAIGAETAGTILSGGASATDRERG